MLVHMVLIVRLLEIFLAHLVCAAVRGNPHIHARLGVGADLDALALMVRGLVEAATSFAESRVNSFSPVFGQLVLQSFAVVSASVGVRMFAP